MATVLPFEDFRVSPTALRFQGGAHGIPVSSFVTAHERGQRVRLHFHPYAELFVVHAGTARFTAGDEELTVDAGNFVIVPPETPHGFECVSDETLQIVSVHPSPEVIQTDL